jgi:hypothetical protein
MELEIDDLQQQLDDLSKAKTEVNYYWQRRRHCFCPICLSFLHTHNSSNISNKNSSKLCILTYFHMQVHIILWQFDPNIIESYCPFWKLSRIWNWITKYLSQELKNVGKVRGICFCVNNSTTITINYFLCFRHLP